MEKTTFVLRSKNAKMVFHNVPAEIREADAFYSFRDGIIMEKFAKKHLKGNIGFVNFEDVAKLYKDVTVVEMIGA